MKIKLDRNLNRSPLTFRTGWTYCSIHLKFGGTIIPKYFIMLTAFTLNYLWSLGILKSSLPRDNKRLFVAFRGQFHLLTQSGTTPLFSLKFSPHVDYTTLTRAVTKKLGNFRAEAGLLIERKNSNRNNSRICGTSSGHVELGRVLIPYPIVRKAFDRR